MKKVLVLFLLVVLTANVFAQANDSSAYRGNALGLILSSSNGKGLVYRYLPKKNGFHIAFVPTSNTNLKFISLNLTGYHEVYRTKNHHLYAQIGVEGVYREHHTEVSKYTGSKYVREKVSYVTNNLNTGLGLAYEYRSGHFGLDLYAGYALYSVQSNYAQRIADVEDPSGNFLNVTGGMAMFFLF